MVSSCDLDKDGALVEYQCTGRDVTDLNWREQVTKERGELPALSKLPTRHPDWDTEGTSFCDGFAERFRLYKGRLIAERCRHDRSRTESSVAICVLMREIQKDPDGFRTMRTKHNQDGVGMVSGPTKALVDDKTKLTGILSVGMTSPNANG